MKYANARRAAVLVSGQLYHARPSARIALSDTKKSKVHLSAASKIAVTQSTEGPLVHREALIGALTIVYWLEKEDIAITTKYESLVNLVKSLGCSYLNDLSIGRYATYISKRIFAVFAVPFISHRK